jgi:hypothetical protein
VVSGSTPRHADRSASGSKEPALSQEPALASSAHEGETRGRPSSRRERLAQERATRNDRVAKSDHAATSPAHGAGHTRRTDDRSANARNANRRVTDDNTVNSDTAHRRQPGAAAVGFGGEDRHVDATAAAGAAAGPQLRDAAASARVGDRRRADGSAASARAADRRSVGGDVVGAGRRRTVPPLAGPGRRELQDREVRPAGVRVGPPTADLPEVGRDNVPTRNGRRGAAIVAARRSSRRRTWGLVVAGAVAVAVVAPTLASQWRDGDSPSTAQLVTTGDPGVTTSQPPAGVVEELVDPVIGKAVSTEMPEPVERTESEPRRQIVGNLGLPLLSGLPWASGVYVPGSKKENAAAFAAWRGRPVDVVVDWSARQNWNDIVNPTWLYDAWQGTPYTKVFGVAPIPEDGSGNLQSCASGAYDDKWRQFGTNIKARGLADQSIIRLGWEFNGNWYAWSAHDPGAFAACFRKVVSAAESTAPELRWDWTVNRGRGQSVKDARAAYPGDAYVDIVGIDSYDMWPGVKSEADWNQHLNGEYGLKFWVDFAKQHGKKVSIPEWGVYPGTAQAGANGGDNPMYISKMHEFFESLGDTLAYEAYFNEDESYYAGSLFGPTQNPIAAAKYSSLF